MEFQSNEEARLCMERALVESRLRSEVDRILRDALKEDIGAGDITTNSILGPDVAVSGDYVCKEDGIVAGWGIVQSVWELLDPTLRLSIKAPDGSSIRKGDRIAHVIGKGVPLLTGERLTLNILQRMSGIATLTRRFVDAVEGTGVIILDTRKTAPGLRALDKLAVTIGGGENHRFGLDDMVLIKDNHITFAGSVKNAVRRVREHVSPELSIIVEVKNLEEVQDALDLDVGRIMLDNMSLEEIQKAVSIVQNRVPLEVSGNITLDNVADFAGTGVQYISVGQLTHSPRALDISFSIERYKEDRDNI